MKRRVGSGSSQRGVKRHIIRFPQKLTDSGKPGRSFEPDAGRVAAQHAHAESLAESRDAASHVSRADHTERFSADIRVAERQGAPDVLRHAGGVAAGGARPENPGGTQIFRIEMIKSDRCGGQEPDTGIRQQRRIATGAGAGNQRIGVFHISGADFSARKIDDFSVRLQHSTQERNLIIGNDFQFRHNVFSSFSKNSMGAEIMQSFFLKRGKAGCILSNG